MKLPRLPRIIKKTADSAASPAGGQARLYGAGAILLLISFVAGLYLFFPTAALKDRIEHEIASRTEVELEMEQVSLLFPPALRGEGITLSAAAAGLPPVELASATVKPLWRTLTGGDSGFSFRAELLGGTVEGTARKSGAIEAHLAQLSYAAPIAPGSSLRVAATVNAASYSGEFPLKAKTDTRIDLTLDGVELTGLETLGAPGGALSLGTVTLKGTGKGQAFKIDRLESTGGNLQVTGGGSLRLAQPLEASRLNLNLSLHPDKSLDKGLTDLLALFAKPGRDGSFRLRVTGTLASPAIK